MTLRAGRGGMLLRTRSDRSVFWNVNETSLYLLSPKNKAASLGCEAVVVAAKDRRFRSVAVWPSMKGKTDGEWTAGLNGNVVPNYRSALSPRRLPANALSKISRCLWTQKEAERDRGHPEI